MIRDLKKFYEMKKNNLISLALWLFVILQLACTERSRLNPIDPDNPVTSGKPQALRVISKKDTVILSWKTYSLKNMKGYNIYRAIAPDSNFVKIDSTSLNITTYYDSNLEYDVTYTYCITAVTETFESSHSDPVHITPGPTYKWIIESDIGDIVKLTHDARNEIFRIYYGGYPNRIAVNSIEHRAWLTDRYSNRIYQISSEGKLEQYLEGFYYLIDLDVSWLDSSLWIIDQSPDTPRIVKLNHQGHVLFTNINFINPRAISVDQKRRWCWVADEGARRIFNINSSGDIVRKIGIYNVAPQNVAVFFEDGSFWIADSSQVYKLFVDERATIRVPIDDFNSISKLDVDQKSGACWVLDRNSVTKLDSRGQKIFVIDGFYYPRSLAVNSYDGSCVVADPYHNRAVIISQDGQSIEEIPGIKYPWDVFVEY